MKRSIIVLAFALCCAATSSAINPLSSTHSTHSDAATENEMLRRPARQSRKSRREARQEKYERSLDSLILLGNYRFVPTDFRMKEPLGDNHYVRNASNSLTIDGSHCNIWLPYFTGQPARYRLTTLHATTNEMRDYKAVKTDNGWVIRFNATLFASDDYEFEITVNPKTRLATLIIEVPFGVTMQYSGSIMSLG